jgi:WD40 repeat protein
MMRFFLASGLCCLTLFVNGQTLETIIQKGHELAVIAVAISPDSNYVATGSRDKSAKLWELSTGREVRSFLGHQFSVNSLDFSSDGKYLITGNGDQTAKVWEVATGKEILSVKPDKERLTDVVFDPKGKYFVTVGFGRKAIVWEFPSKKKLYEFPADGYAGSSGGINLAISPNGEWLAIGEDNSVANVYKTADWKKAYTFSFSEFSSCGGCFTDVDFSLDSRYLLKTTNDGEVARYDLKDGQLSIRYRKLVADLSTGKFSRDGKLLAICTKKEVSIYNSQTGDSIKSINPGIEAEINQAVFTANSKQLLLACDNNVVLIWDIAKNKKSGELTGFLNQRDKGGLTYDPNSYWDSHIAKYLRVKNDVMLSRDNKTLLKGRFGSKVKKWDVATGKTEMEYVGHDKAAVCYQYSRDGKKLLTGGGDGKIIVWNAQRGDTVFTIPSYREPIFSVSYNSDETQILSSSWDGSVKIHDATTGQRLFYYESKNGSAYTARFSQNDLYLITANLPTGLQMLEIDTQTIIRDFIGHTQTVSVIQLTQDGKKILSASWDGTMRLWDIATGLTDRKYTGHVGEIYAAVFNKTENTIYSAGADRLIRQWDAASGKVINTFAGHQSEVTSLQLTNDEKMLISHSVDGVTKFWNLTTGKEFFEHIHFGEKEWMVKNPEGYFNGTQDARQYIHFVNGLKTYSVDQFFHEFYRPDLLPKIFQSRGSDSSKGIQGKLNTSPPPGIRVATIPQSDETQVEVLIKMTDMGGGIETVKLFHNGKSIALDKQTLKLPARKGESTTYRHILNLIGGTNTITASASNKDKVESDPQSVEIVSDRAGKTSICYILAVGINEYKNPKMTLNYARPDAESFGKVVDDKSSLYKNIELHSLYDADATKDNILKKLDELSTKVHQEDVFIFYYAGHGSMVDNQFFFIPTGSSRLYDLSSLQKDAIEASVLQDHLKNIKALKQLIIMDACQSGGSVELLATRGAAEEKAIAQLSRSAGIHVMASAGSEQFATEFAELGHGLFTYLLIKALQGDADGAPKDGKVTIYELKSYLDDQVPEMTQKLKGKPQYPYTFSRGQDFPIVIEKEK